MGGGGLDGYFGEQGLPAGIQGYLERFHRGCIEDFSQQFVPKWDSPNGEGELAKGAYSIAVGGTCMRGREAPGGVE